jgi:hypothetical protein
MKRIVRHPAPVPGPGQDQTPVGAGRRLRVALRSPFLCRQYHLAECPERRAE